MQHPEEEKPVVNLLTHPQDDFINSEAAFPAFIAGYGSGKTTAAIFRAIKLKFDYPMQQIG